MSNKHPSSPFPSCFRPTTTNTKTITNHHHNHHHNNHSTATPPPVSSSNPNLTTCLYQTDIGLFALTWSRNLFSRSLHLHFLLDHPSTGEVNHSGLLFPPSSNPSFHLHIKPFSFWNKQGSKKLDISHTNAYIYWDLSRAKYGSGPEPNSGFYMCIVVGGVMALFVGDLIKEAYARTRAKYPETNQAMVLRREHVYGNKLYSTTVQFGGKERNIGIDCRLGDDPRLYINIDNKKVVQIKHLKWKFRGNERVEVDGVYVQVSWDVYNWLFEDDDHRDGYALFMFKIENDEFEDYHSYKERNNNAMALWSQQSFGFGFEQKKMKKGLLRSARSSSSSSLSSASSSCSSVMEWASMEEDELMVPSGFSLLVYAWKS